METSGAFSVLLAYFVLAFFFLFLVTLFWVYTGVYGYCVWNMYKGYYCIMVSEGLNRYGGIFGLQFSFWSRDSSIWTFWSIYYTGRHQCVRLGVRQGGSETDRLENTSLLFCCCFFYLSIFLFNVYITRSFPHPLQS